MEARELPIDLTEGLRELERRVASKSPFYMAKYVVGRPLMENGKAIGWSHHHAGLSRMIWRLYKSRHNRPQGTILKVEWARQSRKSTVVGSAAICMLLDNPNLRILLESDSAENAEKKLQPIKATFEDPYFIYVFGDLRGSLWKSYEITLKRQARHSDPSIFTSGMGVEKTSQHYDIIIPDDLQTEGNSKTRDQIEGVKNAFRQYESLAVSNYLIINTGTRWAFKDLGEMIDDMIEDDIKQGNALRVFASKYAAFKRKDNGKLDMEKSEFPDILPLEVLRVKRASEGAELFSFNYLLEPVSDETAVFKKQDFRYHDRNIASLKDCNFYLAIDPAGEGTYENADDNAFIVAAVTDFGDFYIMEAINKHLNEQGILKEVIRLAGVYPLSGVMIEQRFKQYQLAAWLKNQTRSKGLSIPWRPFKQDNRSKEMRIKALRAFFENHKIHFRNTMWALEDQLLKFPKAPHDDLADALAFILDMAIVPGMKTAKDFWLREDYAENFQADEKFPELPSATDIRAWRLVKRIKDGTNRGPRAVPLSRRM